MESEPVFIIGALMSSKKYVKKYLSGCGKIALVISIRLKGLLMIEQPAMVKICDIREESPLVKTLFFESSMNFIPGQFIMVWIPMVDEKPFTVSSIQKNLLGISVLKKGTFTDLLHQKRIGDTIGIRGPYGNGFHLQPELHSCVVGGGIGIASLATVIDTLPKITIIQGTRTASEIIYRKRFTDMRFCTEDGSLGFRGTTVDLLEDIVKKQQFQKVYTCGPEKMMFKIVELCKKHHIACEVSLDRYIKCGFGICGQCDCSGQRTCVEGPVFTIPELNTMEDFGRVALLKTGERVDVNNHRQLSYISIDNAK
ncbi:MAG: dihydroorotate dehydrogenase electron transfer subunit [wastewater metagenome]|nr:dihydroorotate dehydrogenase electron transfer subunit [Candidatus Loosdrechtia aerotolerans]